MEDILDPDNTASDVWANRADRSAEIEAKLKEKGLKSRIHRKGHRIGLKNLAYNMRRLVQLERHAMAGENCPAGAWKTTKIPVNELSGWAKIVYKPYA